MNLSLKVALRYLFSKRSFHFITIIIYISIIGITVGVAALICVISIFNGFKELTENNIIGFDPHIRITNKESESFSLDTSLLSDIKTLENVISVQPVITGKIAAINKDIIQVFNIRCYGNNQNIPISSSHISNTIQFRPQGKKIRLGLNLADALHLLPGDTVRLITPKDIETSLRTYSMNTGTKLLLESVYSTNIRDYDRSLGITDLEIGRNIFNLGLGEIHSLDIRINDIDAIDNVKTKITEFLPEDFKIETWTDMNQELLGVMKFEKMMAYAILSLIILITGFNILASLSMTVVEKKKDIATMISMGESKKNVGKIFLYEGILIGTISTVLGTLLGLVLCYGQIYFKWFRFDTSTYIIDSVPVIVTTIDVFMIAFISLTISILSVIYPSRRASRTNIIESLRSE